MTQRHELKLVPRQIELVDNAVVADPEAELRPALQAVMRITFQPPAQLGYFLSIRACV
jgi:hypothetical protein